MSPDNLGITREEALSLLKQEVPEENLIKHCLATEAVMRRLARELDADEELWGLTGLLHDLDYATTKDDMSRHGLVSAGMLEQRGVSEVITSAIKAHNAEGLNGSRETILDYALTAGETITGLIIAVALVYPDKRLKSVKPKSITKRMKEKQFARSVSREKITLCHELNIELPDFARICLEAMSEIDGDLGLS